MSKAGKIKRSREFDTVPESRMVMRFVGLREDTIDREKQTVEIVVATENPVERYDLSRGIVVNEVLAMDGIEYRGGRNQLPIVDSHDRSTVANVLGSVRNLRVEGDELIGDASFARDARSQEAFQKLLDGHLTDFSVTATPKQVAFVERGGSYLNRRGEKISGPADIVTHWMPTDASLCATGADERSTVRRSYVEIPTQTERDMNESLLSALHSLGMPEELTEPDTVTSWVMGNLGARQEDAAETEPRGEYEEKAEVGRPMPEETETEPMAEVQNADTASEAEDVIEKALKADQVRRAEIRAACTNAKLSREFADQLCDERVPLDIARQKIITKLGETNQAAGTPTAPSVNVTESGIERMLSDASEGITYAAMTTIQKGKTFGDSGPSDGAKQFAGMGLRRTAESLLRQVGAPVERMSNVDIAKAVMGGREVLRRFNIQRDGEAYHVTGSFPNLLLDAANKTLLAGYEEAEFTWSMWARQAPSVADFKAINRIRFSESPDLENVPESHDYPEGPMSDAKESYQIEKYGKMFSVSWETVVNDDLDAISRVPQMHGVAARRLQNKKVYEVLTANEAMADGVALFHTSSHGNLASSGAAPSVSTLNTAFTAMMTQTGLNSDVIINVRPRYIIVPAALSGTVLELLQSTSPPGVGGDVTGTSGTANIYGPNGQRPLTAIVEPQLDGNSTTAWYLAADSSQIDTVELSFLQGEEAPVLENEWDFSKDVYRYKIRQTFGVKAIDHRGLYKDPGV